MDNQTTRVLANGEEVHISEGEVDSVGNPPPGQRRQTCHARAPAADCAGCVASSPLKALGDGLAPRATSVSVESEIGDHHRLSELGFEQFGNHRLFGTSFVAAL